MRMTSTQVTRSVRSQPVALIAAGLVIAIFAAIAFAMARRAGGDELAGQPTIGDAPPFSARTLDGGSFDLATHTEQPVLLYFWASWCVPCRTEAPLVQRLWREYEAKGYAFVGMNIWDAETDAQKFARDFGLTFPLVRDPQNAVYLDYGVETLPMAFLIRPGLVVDRRYIGELKEGDLRAMLDHLMEPS